MARQFVAEINPNLKLEAVMAISVRLDEEFAQQATF